MASRYNLLSSNDYELLPEDKISQIAGFLNRRAPQSSDVPVVQPDGSAPEAAAQAEQPQDPNQAIIEYLRQQRQLAEPYLAKSEKGVQEYEQKVKNFENAPQGVNVRPILNWLDSSYGTKLAQGYEAPLSQEEKLQKIAAMYQGLQGSREKAIQDALGLGNNKLMGQALMQQGRKATSDEHAKARIRQQETNTISRWGEQIDKQAGKYTQLVDQAQTDYNTLKKNIEGKELLPSQLFNELQYGLAKLIKGPGALAEGTVERVELNSLQQEWANQVQKISGQIQGAVPDQFKQQLLHSFERLLEQWKERRAGVALQTAASLPMHRIPGSEKDINKKLSAYGTSLPGMEIDKTIHGAVQKHGVEVSPIKENKEPTLEELQAEMARRAAKGK